MFLHLTSDIQIGAREDLPFPNATHLTLSISRNDSMEERENVDGLRGTRSETAASQEQRGQLWETLAQGSW